MCTSHIPLLHHQTQYMGVHDATRHNMAEQSEEGDTVFDVSYIKGDSSFFGMYMERKFPAKSFKNPENFHFPPIPVKRHHAVLLLSHMRFHSTLKFPDNLI